MSKRFQCQAPLILCERRQSATRTDIQRNSQSDRGPWKQTWLKKETKIDCGRNTNLDPGPFAVAPRAFGHCGIFFELSLGL